MFAVTPLSSTKCKEKRTHAHLDGRVPAPTPAALHSLEDLTPKVLCNVRNVADSITVRKEIPAAGAVAVVVEPGAEDEVGCNAEEETKKLSASA